MSDSVPTKEIDDAVLLAARAITKAALDMFYVDPHQWSTRPCQTCSAVSALTGAPFGCERYKQDGRRS
jgi:hypothetical protein